MRPAEILAAAILSAAAIAGCAAIVPIADLSEHEYALASSRSVGESELQRGYEIYTRRCTRCHRARPVHDYTVAQWDALLPRMIEQTRLDADDAAAVTAFVAVRGEAGAAIPEAP